MAHRLTPIARHLRRDATAAERRLWRAINQRQVEGFRFRRQVILQDYVVDFACFEARLVIEVDDATHSADEELSHDATRDVMLADAGYAVLRFRNSDIYENLDGAAETIRLALLELRPRIADTSGASVIVAPPTLTLPHKGGGDDNGPC